MYITINFKMDEFECHDGTPVPYQLEENVRLVAENLQVLRDYLNKPVHVLSGYRTKSYNSHLKGASPKSQHMLGKAADIVVHGIPPWKIADMIEELIRKGKMMEGGVGRYDNFTHYDVRGHRARWDLT